MFWARAGDEEGGKVDTNVGALRPQEELSHQLHGMDSGAS